MRSSNRGAPLWKKFKIRFIATFQVNYRNLLLEVKDIISSLGRFASCLYIGKPLHQMQSIAENWL